MNLRCNQGHCYENRTRSPGWTGSTMNQTVVLFGFTFQPAGQMTIKTQSKPDSTRCFSPLNLWVQPVNTFFSLSCQKLLAQLEWLQLCRENDNSGFCEDTTDQQRACKDLGKGSKWCHHLGGMRDKWGLHELLPVN